MKNRESRGEFYAQQIPPVEVIVYNHEYEEEALRLSRS
jgi:hypothetical protein